MIGVLVAERQRKGALCLDCETRHPCRENPQLRKKSVFPGPGERSLVRRRIWVGPLRRGGRARGGDHVVDLRGAGAAKAPKRGVDCDGGDRPRFVAAAVATYR